MKRVEKDLSQPVILLIDDDPLVLESVAHFLEKAGYKIFAKKSALKSLPLLSSEKLDIILCDQMLPEMSGIEFLKKAHDIQPQAERVLFTGFGNYEVAKCAINLGHVSHYFTKPLDLETLQRALDQLIEKRRLLLKNERLQNEVEKNHNKLLQDLKLGRSIQKELLTAKMPEADGLRDIAFLSLPSFDVDGDFFEFFSPSSNVLDLVVADVMGKGVPAALLASYVKAAFRREAEDKPPSFILEKDSHFKLMQTPVVTILQNVQNGLYASLDKLEYFISLFYGRFFFDEGYLEYIDLGFPKPFHLRCKGSHPLQLSGGYPPLGTRREVFFQTETIPFSEGDLFLFFSDGAVDQRNKKDEMYGEKRLKEAFYRAKDKSPKEVIECIKEDIERFLDGERITDDITLVTVKIGAQGKSSLKKTKSATFRADPSQLGEVRNFVKRCCSDSLSKENRITHLMQLAVNEAFCNIAKHGYRGECGPCLIEALCDGEKISFILSDQGSSLPFERIGEPNLHGEKESGFGWHIIRSIVDEASYLPKEKSTHWNRLKLVKYIEDQKKMDIDISSENKVCMITPRIEFLDLRNTDQFKESISKHINEESVKEIVIDLSCIDFVDSSGLGSLLSLLKLANSQKKELRLCSLTPKVRTIFEIVSMHKIFEIYNSKDEAIRSFLL